MADASEPAYHELYEVGAGYVKVRTSTEAKRAFLDDPQLEDPVSDLLASDRSIKYQYQNKKDRSYLDTTIFCSQICSLNEGDRGFCALHLADGTFLYLNVDTDVALEKIQEAEQLRMSM
uniref:Uncharacterized protein n=1 Tax=Eutreptiella gymnastica TaxID=73025 RepID=A0A7S4FVD6_9EUGL|mmetsp:Transcript_12724/g.19775  ORF Transcript_12724/g.19775 Transcript_12724/m.19775 type:complete len:119 (-) Transcript_12724:936-1292(-)